MNQQRIRVRIAPSPTGVLHIGTVRTALFNYLFARHHGGTMIVRVEDTDQVRSQQAYTDNILAGFKQLGLDWDEGPEVGGEYGPYFQTQRFDLYEEALQKLLDNGQAYPCYFHEEIEAERQQAQAEKKDYIYQGHYREATDLIAAKQAAGVQPVYRLKNPKQDIIFNDLVRGEVKFDSSLMGDMIIARSDRSVLYNFAVVVDDALMKITHVIRGEDHISNTPKQIMLYQALGYELPIFAHTAMMLAPDRSKLSKRHGATAIADYLDQGYLPEALLNYLALLGWSPPEGQEIFSKAELIDYFSFEKVNKSGAVFDLEKLKWVNGQWIRRQSPSQLLALLQPFYEKADLVFANKSGVWLEEMVALIQDKLTLLNDAVEQTRFLQADLVFNPDLVDSALLGMDSAQAVLEAFLAKFKSLDPWDKENIHAVLEQLKQELPFKMKQIMWPLRAALTGQTAGPDLIASIALLGKTTSCHRLEEALRYIGVYG